VTVIFPPRRAGALASGAEIGETVEVKIGIQSVQRELVLETNAGAAEVEQALAAAISDGTVLVLEDDKGGKVLVPADKIAYLEVGAGEQRRVGFGAYR
jgi:Protein of unknown function (DUF3107)